MLEETYGIMVYQEQVMQMAQIVGGYSLGGADLLRRAMGKKVPAEMAKHREIFREGAGKDGVGQRKADEIFDLMEKFAGYGFNKSHAAAYSLVAYQTAWLKKHYPAEFMAATLSSDMDKTDKVVAFLDECRDAGARGAAAGSQCVGIHVRGHRRAHRALRAGRDQGRGPRRLRGDRQPSARTAARSTPCWISASAWIRPSSTAARWKRWSMPARWTRWASNRASLMLQLPEVVKATEQLAKEREAGQVSLFGGGDAAPALEVVLTEVDEWPLSQKLAGERETLGHYLSGHPLDPWRDDLRGLVGTDLGELDKLWSSAPQAEKKGWRPEVSVVIAGQVVALRKKGDSQMFVQLEDGRGRIECSVFSEAYTQLAPLLTRDRILVVQGGLREDEFSGGFSLRVRQCWDYAQLCSSHAQRLSLRLDMRVPGMWDRIDALLARHRPGGTPLRLDLLLKSGDRGVAGVLDLNGPKSVRVDTELLDALRAQPGVRTVKVAISRPWAN